MNSAKLQGIFRKAWLCPCLISLLSACATLQKPQERAVYRVIVHLPPGTADAELAAALTALPASQVDFKPYYDGLDIAGNRQNERTVMLTLPDEKSVQELREQLQTIGLPLQVINIAKE